MLKYFLISRKNPITKEYAFHASATPVTPIRMNELAQDISDNCTATVHDVKVVISALEESIYKALRSGKSVRLGDLGSFHARIASKSAATEEDFKEENLLGVKVRFTPSSKMRYELSLKNPKMELQRQ